MKEHPIYLAYLLRLWQVGRQMDSHHSAAEIVWRASLENPHTHERQGFANLDELFDFLRTQTNILSRGNEGQDEVRS